MSFLEDRILIKMIKAGDSGSFHCLYDRYVSDLWHFIHQYVKSEEVTDEVVQDTFIRLWLYRNRLDENRSVKSLLFTISYRQMLKEIKRQVKNPQMRGFVEFSDGLETEDKYFYDYDVYVKALEIAKKSLTPRQREIWQLSREKEMSTEEIAKYLSIQEQVVRNQLSSALKKIREQLVKII
jgi:RNA polymerase sigma-70 factor (ECF subfamily)